MIAQEPPLVTLVRLARFRYGDLLASGGDWLSSAAGLVVLRHIREEGLAERAAELGERVLRPRMEDLAARHRGVLNPRGVGLLQGWTSTGASTGPMSARA